MKICTGCGKLKKLFFQLRCYECRSNYRKKYSASVFKKVCPSCKKEHQVRLVPECGLKCRIKNRVKHINGCWEWKGALNDQGYGILTMNKKRFFAHRMSYSEFVGIIPEGMCVLHKCDNPACANPDHLFLGTREENVKDMCSKLRNNHGNMKNLTRNTSNGRFESVLRSET